VLAYIHLVLFDHVPNLTNHVLSSDLFVIAWDNARDKPATAQLAPLFEEVLEFPELTAHNHVPVSLMVNHVLHHPTRAVVRAMQHLALNQKETALWTVYALSELQRNNDRSAAVIYAQTLRTRPSDWQLWYHRAMYSVKKDPLDTVLACIAAAVLVLAPTPLVRTTV